MLRSARTGASRSTEDADAARRDNPDSAAKSPRINASFLFSPPAFRLSFRSDRIFDAFELLMEDEGQWTAPGRVAIESVSFVLGDPHFQPAVCRPDVIGPVGAAQNGQVSAHSCFTSLILRDAAGGGSSGQGARLEAGTAHDAPLHGSSQKPHQAASGLVYTASEN